MKTYGRQGWSLAQVKAELVYKTTWGSSVVTDLVTEIERLQVVLIAANSEQHEAQATDKLPY
jgi:hypothetical protein